MRSRDSFLVAIVLSILMFWGIGCIPVDDLGGYWDNAVIDPGARSNTPNKLAY